MGKSSLAFKAMHECEDMFEIVIPIYFESGLSFGAFLLEMAKSLTLPIDEFEKNDIEGCRQAILNALGTYRRAIIYADSYEYVLRTTGNESLLRDGAVKISGFLENVPPNIVVLVTSTQRQNLKGERMISLDGLTLEEGRKFFIELAGWYIEKNPPVEITNAIEEIVKKIGGHPLQLEIFAKGYRGEGLLELRAMLDYLPVGDINRVEETEHKRYLGIKQAPRGPDLLLIVNIAEKGRGYEYEIGLMAPSINYPYVKSEAKQLFTSPKSEFRTFFKEIEKDIMNYKKTPNMIKEKLRAQGVELYRSFISGTKLDNIIWNNFDNIKSVQVISNEPWIPWEMLKPFHEYESEDGRSRKVVEAPFFCEKFAFSRWIYGNPTVPKDRLNKVNVIAPKDINLDGSKQESEWIENFSKAIKFDLSMTSGFEEVMALLQNGGYDLLHFSTHGIFNEEDPQASKILLENKSFLQPNNITGINAAFGNSNPLVILNTCQSGAQEFYLTGLGGWVQEFLSAHVSTFIGTMWSVTDAAAFVFTRELYQLLSKGITMDEAVRLAREAIKKEFPADPSWLAYTLYCTPNSISRLCRYDLP